MSTATVNTVPTDADTPSVDAATLRATVPQADLAVALRWARHSITNRPPVPVLGGVLLHADRGALTIEAYDYETATMSRTLAAGASGRAVLDARVLADVVKAIGRGVDVRLEAVTPSRLRVVGAGVEYTLATLPTGEYPTLPDPSAATHIASMSGQDLVDLARATVAACRDETLPILTAVAFDTSDGRLRAAATDRYRLVVIDGPEADMPGRLLVPAKRLKLVAAQFRKEPVVTISHLRDEPGWPGRDSIVFSAGNRFMNTICIDGEYPKIHSLFPTDEPTLTIDVDRDALALAVHQVGMVAERNTPVAITPVDDGIQLTAGYEDFAAAAKTIPAEVTGDRRRVAVNPAFLLDLLRTLPGEQVRLTQTTDRKPVIVAAPTDPSIRTLLMPVRYAD